MCLITEKMIYCANAGDARSYLFSDKEAIQLSFDHKPDHENEKQRIEKIGGIVTPDGRINGNINVSRALGRYQTLIISL